jgi:hypothetical protein
MGPNKKWRQNKMHQKGSRIINKCCFLEIFQVPGNICLGEFGNLIGFIAPEMVPWLSKKSEDQSGGPRTNLAVFGDEVSFQYFPKT